MRFGLGMFRWGGRFCTRPEYSLWQKMAKPTTKQTHLLASKRLEGHTTPWKSSIFPNPGLGYLESYICCLIHRYQLNSSTWPMPPQYLHINCSYHCHSAVTLEIVLSLNITIFVLTLWIWLHISLIFSNHGRNWMGKTGDVSPSLFQIGET